MTNIAMFDHVRRTPRGRWLVLSPLLRMAALATAAPLLSGCIDWDAWAKASRASGSSTPMSTSPDHILPQPSVWRFPRPPLDAAGQKRLLEVERFIADQYQAAGWQIMETTQSMGGDLYDWIDVNSIEGADKEPPPTTPPEEMQLPDGVERALTELDVDPELQRPEGTVPVRRPEFAPYVLGESEATSLEEFLTEQAVPGDASGGTDRLYAGMVAYAPNQGANANISMYGALIEDGTLSVLEMVVGCPNEKGEMWQYIGIAASRDYVNKDFVNFGDSKLRIQVEFFTKGVKFLGPESGGWHGTRTTTDFIPYKDAPYGPGTAITAEQISTIGGPQHDSLFQIKWVNGDWWVGHNGYWLGHFPKKLFDKYPPNMIEKKACLVQWYGEVFASSTKLDQERRPWTWTDMGSGEFAEKGWSKAAYFREPSYVSLDAAGTWAWPDSDPAVVVKDIAPPQYNPGCYTKTPLQSGPAGRRRFFHLGGPGARGPDSSGSATCK
jgi:hypothetical protein